MGIAAIAIFIGTGVSNSAEDAAAEGPKIGEHWHAIYTITVCGVLQPTAPTWESGIHTHGDGVIHSHPFESFEEGDGARLVKWFEYGAGLLTEDELRIPGSPQTFRAGDVCPNGEPGSIQVLANDLPVDIPTYIPQDGDRIEITFGGAP